MQQPLIEDYEMKLEIPGCNPGGGHYHAFLQLRGDITEVLPYLNAALGNFTDYYHQDGILIWTSQGKRYAFRPREIGMAPVRDHEEACELANGIIAMVNDIWQRRHQIKPNFEGGQLLPNMLDIYKLLPRTNCRECGFPTCMAFAVALREDAAKSSLCPYFQGDKLHG
jgi:ArsR family metal-binding transcriptional regulator